MPPHPTFGLFVSPVAGHLVSRYGTATQKRAPQLIGYVREPIAAQDGPVFDHYLPGAGQPVLQEGAVVALTHHEVARFGREYRRALRNGALVERTEQDWSEWIDSQDRPGQPAEVSP